MIFFYLTGDQIANNDIEEEFLRSVILSPQESRSLSIDESRLKLKLFWCRKTKTQLRDKAALSYIESGEDLRLHERRSVASRRLWYDLGERKLAKLAMNYLLHSTARTYLARNGLHFSDNFHELYTDTARIDRLCLSMNSSITQLQLKCTRSRQLWRWADQNPGLRTHQFADRGSEYLAGGKR